MYSIVIPVYKEEASIPDLLMALRGIGTRLNSALEVVFVVDGSPDQSFQHLALELPTLSFKSKLIALSRNFGSFAAIRVGLEKASGPYFAVMTADLQEPDDLIVAFLFSFSDLPIKVLLWIGSIGIVMSLIFSVIVLWARLSGRIHVPGYSPIVLTVTFFGSINLICFGIVGSYVWRAYENTKKRPGAVVLREMEFN